MSTDNDDRQDLRAALDALRQEVASLSERMAAIEHASERPPAAQQHDATADGAARPPAGEATPELIAVISAALAAYLGVKPHIRQITLLGGASWAQQGRVTIQASHALAMPRD